MLAAATVAAVAACGPHTVLGSPVAGPSSTSGPGTSRGDAGGAGGPTADIDINPPATEPTRTFPPGGPSPCEAEHDQPLCFPKREVSVKSLYNVLQRRSWDCYREGQKTDADLEVSDTFECQGSQGKVGKISLHHTISGNAYMSNKTSPLEMISVSATAAENGSGNGTEPTTKDAQRHSVKAFTFMLKHIWATAHPDWVKEAAATFTKMQPHCRTLRPLDNGISPPTADLKSGYRITCTSPIAFNLEGQTTITQTASLEAPFDNTLPK